jgi:hypothetical protein
MQRKKRLNGFGKKRKFKTPSAVANPDGGFFGDVIL